MRRQATGWNRGGSARPTTHIGSFCPLQATVSYFLEEEILVQAHAPALPKILHNSWTFSYDMGSRSSTILIERLPNLEGTRPDTAGTRRVICSLAQEGCLSFSCVSYKYSCVCALASCFLSFFPFFTFSSFSSMVPNPFLCVICRWVGFWEAKLDLWGKRWGNFGRKRENQVQQ